MRNLLWILALTACGASAQTCEQATRNYNVSNGANVRNQEMVDKAYGQMLQICGGEPAGANPPPARPQQQQQARTRIPPGAFVNCDQAGCWGAGNSVRYTFVAGGNMSGSDGSFCARGAGNTFSCN